MTAYADFTAYIAQINDLLCAANLLTWDSRTQMPAQGAATRGQQIGDPEQPGASALYRR